ncbi:Retrovirus-related Pol polyprotein from transposon opus [Portunus trituberculatus]|uniref:RNA-directed DNA polymerase n=1 Tax=Portunus trituberculatus TaxID=210409 RepID=A0A5B7JXF2_PORTR|nr:Retrovirus-related Pol polyprotein from transposon opus [Portunus trituberculatus]
MEALAVVWALKHFHDIIYNYPVTVYTNHSAVTQLFLGKNLTGRLARWFLTVEQFQAEIKYLPGRASLVPDALSRNVVIAAVTQVHNFSHQDLTILAQGNDPIWSKVIYAQESGDETSLPKLPIPLRELDIHNDILTLTVQVYDREVQQIVIPDSLVPTVLHFVHDAPQAGHPGRDKTLAMARLKYYIGQKCA